MSGACGVAAFGNDVVPHAKKPLSNLRWGRLCAFICFIKVELKYSGGLDAVCVYHGTFPAMSGTRDALKRVDIVTVDLKNLDSRKSMLKDVVVRSAAALQQGRWTVVASDLLLQRRQHLSLVGALCSLILARQDAMPCNERHVCCCLVLSQSGIAQIVIVSSSLPIAGPALCAGRSLSRSPDPVRSSEFRSSN